MNIAAGLSGLSSAVTMMRALRDLAKAGELKADEIPLRISEIYDYIVDSKDALVDAKDEISKLKAELDALKKDRDVFLEGEVNWEKRTDDQYDGPLCPVCWGINHKILPMVKNNERNHPEYVVFICSLHPEIVVDRKVPKTVLAKYVKNGKELT